MNEKQQFKQHVTKVTQNKQFSFSQKQLLFLQSLYPATTLLNIGGALKLSGIHDIAKIKQACIKIYKRHQVLQTVVRWEAGGAVPEFKFKPNKIFKIYPKKITDSNELIKTMQTLNFQSFNLYKGPLVRFILFKFNEDFILFINAHHIVFDGWSLLICARELLAYYLDKKLPPVKLNYYDLMYTIDKQAEQTFKYWLNHLQPLPPKLAFPFDKPKVLDKPVVQEVPFTIDKENALLINEFCRNNKITPFVFFFTIFEILLSRFCQQNDFVISIPVNSRETSSKNLIGFLVNILPIKVTLDNQLSIKEIIDNNTNLVSECLKNKNIPLQNLVKALNIHGTGFENLFQVAFVMQNISSQGIKKDNVHISHYWSESGHLPYNLTLEIVPYKRDVHREYSVLFKYDANLFEDFTIKIISQYFKTLANKLVKETQLPIKEINILNAEAKEKLIVTWNDTDFQLDTSHTINVLFERIAQNKSKSLAVVEGNKCITYQELNARANRLANFLIESNIKENDIVGVSVKYGIDVVTCFIAVLKAGGTYLYIDPGLPEKNYAKIIKDSAPKIILNSIDDELLKKYPKNNLNLTVSGQALAYIIYTSGTTGEPKGVMIQHKNILNSLNAFLRLNINTYKFLNLFSYSFDGSVASIWWPLLQGHTLVLSEFKEMLPELIKKEEITVLHVTPSLLEALLEISTKTQLRTIEDIVVAGERFTQDLVKKIKRFFNDNVSIWNFYGVSECTIFSAYYEVKDNNLPIVPIGKPIINTRFYVLDKQENLVPIGIAGELYIAGDNVALGYLNNQTKTNEKFIEKTFLREERLYKTGDIVRRSADGNLIYIGRQDKQEKIRGYRVEIESIEYVLKQHEKIQDAIINLKENNGKKYIVAYIVSKLHINDIKNYLEDNLPKYMIPDFIFTLPKLPLNTSGKIDSAKLPKVHFHKEKSRKSGTGKSIVEKRLIKIWSKVLKIDEKDINTTDSFFDLGGDSISVMQMVYLSTKKGIKLTPQDIFKYKNIANIAQNLRKRKQSKWRELIKKTILKFKHIFKF